MSEVLAAIREGIPDLFPGAVGFEIGPEHFAQSHPGMGLDVIG